MTVSALPAEPAKGGTRSVMGRTRTTEQRDSVQAGGRQGVLSGDMASLLRPEAQDEQTRRDEGELGA